MSRIINVYIEPSMDSSVIHEENHKGILEIKSKLSL